jgi:hypothetical protein
MMWRAAVCAGLVVVAGGLAVTAGDTGGEPVPVRSPLSVWAESVIPDTEQATREVVAAHTSFVAGDYGRSSAHWFSAGLMLSTIPDSPDGAVTSRHVVAAGRLWSSAAGELRVGHVDEALRNIRLGDDQLDAAIKLMDAG